MLTAEDIKLAIEETGIDELWLQLPMLARSPIAYKAVCNFILESQSYYAVVFRVSPFRGAYTDADWIFRYTAEEFEEPRSTVFDVPNWLGTNVNYIFDGIAKQGTTTIKVYQANEDARKMLSSVGSLDGWRPPLPDDFMVFGETGHLLLFVNSHEGHCDVRRGSRLCYDLLHACKMSL